MKQRVDVGSEWGAKIGYSRAARAGNFLVVSGTSAGGPSGVLHKGDAEKQAEIVLGRIGDALRELGASLDDVIETRIFLRDMKDWEAIGKAHARAFAVARPATTMVQAGALIDPDMLVEIAATAIVGA
jgi:enamine deaminase RidA (YjgF/YER057c/UK114 family)